MRFIIDKIKKKYESDVSIDKLFKLLMIVLIIYIMWNFSPIFAFAYKKIKLIITPFLIGFGIAYLLRPIIVFFEKKNISRKYVIPILVLFLVITFWWIFISIFPMLYEDIVLFVKNSVETINHLIDQHVINSDGNTDLFTTVSSQLINFLNNQVIPNITNYVTHFLSTLLTTLSKAIFALVLSIYFMLDYEKIIDLIYAATYLINSNLPEYVYRIDQVVSVYIRSLLVLMIIKFLEYSVLYRLVGHRNWMILGLLTSLGLVVPYIGPMVANTLGIFTSINLPLPNLIILMIAIAILSMVDEYLITPLIHSKNSEIKPLWSMFAVFVGGTLFKAFGIVIAVPVYLAVRVSVNYYREIIQNTESV